ncbi:hypothetical protein BMI79_01520 [Serratia oryzae]|uniref:NADP-dependent oxidoreductase domain-containing protein n=1 Tax=Serratia oryzae TaxID=2034155 RepID=A0A1S8CP05_9GAMM|nr:hypothetical protein BMI79_01520 [Serratia oryzae]
MCLDAGINLFDTADVYSAGKSEEILAQAWLLARPTVTSLAIGYCSPPACSKNKSHLTPINVLSTIRPAFSGAGFCRFGPEKRGNNNESQ